MVKSSDKFENDCILMHCGARVVIQRLWRSSLPFQILSNSFCALSTVSLLFRFNLHFKCLQFFIPSARKAHLHFQTKQTLTGSSETLSKRKSPFASVVRTTSSSRLWPNHASPCGLWPWDSHWRWRFYEISRHEHHVCLFYSITSATGHPPLGI